MVKLVLRRERCKACGLCVKHCPKGTLQEGEDLNELGYHAVVQVDPEKCTGCGLCAVMCPDVCIDLYKTADAVKEVAR
jgi:2-oxoglutarate ferredoxin oxidoreductase subunit delta